MVTFNINELHIRKYIVLLILLSVALAIATFEVESGAMMAILP